MEKAARAGCVQVFIGMETIRDDNLEAGGKRQNKAADYREMIAAWHREGVVCHVGYIIGFPHDTYERVMEDVRALRDELLVDQASFFMLTPLPGSEDHRRAVEAGVAMDPDYNNFDSFHPTVPHPRMSRGRVDPRLPGRVDRVLLLRADAADAAAPEPAHVLGRAQEPDLVPRRHDRAARTR